MKTPREYKNLQRFQHVAAPGSNLVCVGKSGRSFNYAPRDDVYSPDRQHIPTANNFGSIDHIPNENYRNQK